MAAKKFNPLKLAVAAVVAPYCFWYATVPGWHFIDGFDLAVHEFGHLVFGNFGEFIGVLGGSLMQCLAPALLLVYFVWQRSYFSATLMGYWVGINLVNVSVYAGDAEAQDLPLFGGEGVIHDWNWLLTELNWLPYTPQVARAIHSAGLVVMVFSLFFSIMSAREDASNDAQKGGDRREAEELDAMMKGK